MVTVPTLRPAPVIAVVAAAWVMPTTLGTVTVGTVPVPVKLTEAFPPSLVILIVALFAPAVAGANATPRVALAPAARGETVVGENVNSELDEEMLVTLRVAVPVFFIEIVWADDVVPAV